MSATPSAMDAQKAPSPRTFALQHRRPPSSFQGCSKIHDYEMLGKLGEGTFGEVYRARHKKSGEVFALKKIIMHNEKDGFPITALREIKLLKSLSHKNILRLQEMAVEHPTQRPDQKRKRPMMYMVTPYMEHDLSGLLENPAVTFTEAQIKCYLLQLLKGLKYLHENNILHRDMKAANLLIDNKGILQIADFGLARHYEGDVPQPGRGGGNGTRDYTSLVVTRWYRPPELLLSLKKYTTAIDVWGVGCVFGEMLVGKPILAGESDGHQLELIWDLCGTATEETMPGWRQLPGAQGLQPKPRPSSLQARFNKFGPQAISLLRELLKLDWRTRTNAMDAMKHPYFTTSPLPLNPRDIPTFEDSHELDRRKYQDRKAALPPAPKGGTVGRGPDGPGGPNAGFDGDYGRANGRHPPGDRGSRPRGGGDDEPRRPAWARDRPPHLGLPPRPPPPADGFSSRDLDYRDRDHRDRDRGGRPRPRDGGGRDRAGGDRDRDRDTYRPPRDDYRRDDDRDRYRNDYRDRGSGYDDRPRRRSRSRSPRRRDGYSGYHDRP